MSKVARVLLCACCLMPLAAAADTAELPPVNVTATDAALSDVLSRLAAQAGVGIYLAEEPDTKVTVDLHDAELEAAIHAAARQANCSWVRIYLLEPLDAAAEEYDFNTLARLVGETRKQRFERMSDEQREQMAVRIGEAAHRDADPDAGMPVGGWSAHATREGGQLSDADRAARWAMSDPLRFATSGSYSDPVSLQLTDADIIAFTDALADASGFTVVSRLGDIQDKITLDLTDAAVDDIVAAAAEQLGCNWHRAYLVAPVRQLSEAEVNARLDQWFNAGMGYFWSQPQETRADIIRRIVDRSERLTEEQKTQIRSSQTARTMMTKFLTYSNTLSMEQRRELIPLLQQAAKIMAK